MSGTDVKAMVGKRLIAQVLVYLSGLLVLAFGTALGILSDLGISPVISLPYAVHAVSGLGAGLTVALFFLICIALQILILRGAFRWLDLSQILVSFVFGYLVDFALFVMDGLVPSTYLERLAMLAVSMILVAVGIGLYLEAKLINLPPEGLILAIVSKAPNTSFHRVKIVMDCALVALAVTLTLAFLGSVYGVREGTALCAILIGKLMSYTKKPTQYLLGRLGFYTIMEGVEGHG